MENISLKSPLRDINPIYKLSYFVLLIGIVIYNKSFTISIITFLFSLFIFFFINKGSLDIYVGMIKAPIIFILLSGIGVMISFAKSPSDYLFLGMGDLFINITRKSQIDAQIISMTALSSVSLLITLGATTSIGDLIYALKKIKTPKIIIEMMYIIYRYIFLLSRLLNSMQTSGGMRGGFDNFKNTFRTSKYIAMRLFNKSMRMSLISYTAMESRLYEGDISFLKREYEDKNFILFIIFLIILIGAIIWN